MGSFNSLDDADFTGQDLTKISFVKGSLRRAKFDGGNLSGTNLFGATLTSASFKGTTLRGTDLESTNLEGANFTDAVLEAALLTNAQFGSNKIDNSDWTDVLLRRDQNKYLCTIAKGTNPETGVDTRESLSCP